MMPSAPCLLSSAICAQNGRWISGAGQIGWAATDDHHDLVLEVQTGEIIMTLFG